MSRNRDAVRLSEVKGINYSSALRMINQAHDEAENESQHSVALRLIAEAEQELEAG